MPLDRLRENARKVIGESTEFLEASAVNRHEPGDSWRRMTRKLEGLGGINGTLHQLEGHRRTGGLSNACESFD